MSVSITENGEVTRQVSADDYQELIKIAQEHVALLREIFKGDSEYGKYEKAWWAGRVCLSAEEAAAVNCLEYKDGLEIAYVDGNTVSRGAFCIIQDTVKLYSPSNVVIEEFKIRDVKEMYHDEARKVLKVCVAGSCGMEIAAEDQATLRSIYYNLLLRHPEADKGQDPVASTEAKIKRALPTTTPSSQVQAADLTTALTRQQTHLEKLATSLPAMRVQNIPAAPPAPPAYLTLPKRPLVRNARRAVICNVTYKDTPYHFPQVQQNLASMSDFLCARGFGGDKVMLTDTDPKAVPTKRNILKAFSWLVEGAKHGDALFLSISGHGGQQAATTHGIPEGLCPSDYQTAGLITGDEIRGILRVPHGATLTIVNELSQGGNVLALPSCVVKKESFEVADGGLQYPHEGGDVIIVGTLKDTAGGRDSITAAYCKAMNYIPECTAAQLLSALQQALTAFPSSPMLSSYTPIPSSRTCGLGGTTSASYIPSEGTDKDALTSYHTTSIGSWQPPFALDSTY